MRQAIATCLIFASTLVAAAPNPYDEGADAKADIRAALVEAKSAGVPVLVVFGANWCADCKMLDTAFKTGTAAPVIAKSFKVVKVNVGRFDHNVDIADSYGVPLKKGIPAVAMLSPQGTVTYVTQSGELADARSLGDDGVYQFFAKISTPTRP